MRAAQEAYRPDPPNLPNENELQSHIPQPWQSCRPHWAYRRDPSALPSAKELQSQNLSPGEVSGPRLPPSVDFPPRAFPGVYPGDFPGDSMEGYPGGFPWGIPVGELLGGSSGEVPQGEHLGIRVWFGSGWVPHAPRRAKSLGPAERKGIPKRNLRRPYRRDPSALPNETELQSEIPLPPQVQRSSRMRFRNPGEARGRDH